MFKIIPVDVFSTDVVVSINQSYDELYECLCHRFTKEELLDEVLDKHYQVCRNHVEIIEYPTIKIY
jgi:hypothetical protein